jgi:hypothetical protein
VAAGGVQLGHHVVQKKQRAVAHGLPHHFHLGQLERQGAGALLPARAIDAQIATVHAEGDVIPMRAQQGSPGGDLASAAAPQLDCKLLSQLLA